jgi:hypothetical protein
MRLLSVNILLSTAKQLKKEGWKFDWDKSFGAISQKIAYLEKEKIQGLLDAGFEGFVVFDSKTILIDHYVEKYGAQILFGNRLYFDTKASKALINKYLKGKNNG